jgi:hypothetical protein
LRNIFDQRAIVKGFLLVNGVIQANEVVPMVGLAIAWRSPLTVNMNPGGFFPKCPVRQHHLRLCRWEFQVQRIFGRIE